MATAVECDGEVQGEGAPAVVYVRVSPGKGQAAKVNEPDGYSLPAQLTACKRKAVSLKAVVIEEFVERSESAKTSLRPELQRMLEFVKENRVRYVIVHKVDRLARNRIDDAFINLALQQAGAELVSVSENINQTPSGLLLHGIMSSIAEFYSRNLATEVIKGSVQKAKNGGTPGKAPLGYLNVRQVVNGLEGRTVEVDPERGPLMAWCFREFATGEWTIRTMLAELTAKGLTTVPGPKTPSTPLTVSHLHRLLRHPYYVGIVRYQGVLYQGKHEQLVDHDTWQRVQELLTAKYLTGEKHREHPHYLKGSIFCGQCGSRLIVCHAKGRGGTYPYFICIGRQQKRTECTQRALKIEKVEAEVARYYATIQLAEDEQVTVRAFLEEELTALRLDAERERRTPNARASAGRPDGRTQEAAGGPLRRCRAARPTQERAGTPDARDRHGRKPAGRGRERLQEGREQPASGDDTSRRLPRRLPRSLRAAPPAVQPRVLPPATDR
jgi:site-specific DNA recombinase